MTTELCTYTRNACDIARRTGVERIELCAAPLEGGTTPSAGLIRYARSLPGLRLSVMIRPRGGDFLYTDDEVALMAEEIRLAREYGADGVVFGLLTPAGEVDETRTAQLVREAEGMEVTFHRAFDMTCDLSDALEEIVRAGCTRILTSGGRNTASEGIGDLRALVVRAAGRNGNLLLNIGPQPDGKLPATAVERLREMGEWLARYGESIYGTRGGDIPPHGWGVTTRKGDKLYVHVLDLQDDALYLPLGQRIASARCLNNGEQVSYTTLKERGIVLDLRNVPQDTDRIIELTLR